FNLYGVSGRKRLGPVSTDAITAAVTQEVALPQPGLGELSASEVTSDSVHLSWTIPAGNFDSFLLQYKYAEGKPQTLPVDGASRSVTVINLAPSHRYKFSLYGISGRKRYGPVSTDAITEEEEGKTQAQPSLGELSASSETSDSVLLSWTVPTGSFDSFIIQYKDTGGSPQVLPVEGDSREVTVSNLVPSSRYKFNLYGTVGRQRLGPVSADVVTAPVTMEDEVVSEEEETVAAQPSLGEISVSEVTHDSLLLSWRLPEGNFDSFIIQYKDAEGKPQALPVDGVLRSLHLYNLVPSYRYRFSLYGISGRRRLGPITTDAVTAPKSQESESAQPSLGELSASDVASDSVRLSWTVESGSFDSFTIQYKDAEGRPQTLPVEGGSRTVTVPNLIPSRRYKFNLYGISGRKRLGPVSTDTITAPATQAEDASQLRLGELSASDVSPDSVLLSWTVDSGSFDSFIIQYKDAEGLPQALPQDGTSRSVTVPNLAPSRRYKFNLYGVSGRKRLGPVSTDAQVVVPRPSLGELSVSEVTPDSVLLSWTVPSGSFDSFIIQYKDAEGRPQALPMDGASRTVTVPNLAPSRRYKFNLYGISGRKRLGPVSADTVTGQSSTPGPEAQPRLGDLSISEVTKDSVRLTWSVSAGTFDSFLLQYKDAEGRPQALPTEGASRTVVVSDLVPSHRYKFNLYGLARGKRLGPISNDAVTGAYGLPGDAWPHLPLPQPAVSELTPTSLRLSWDAPEGDFDSFLIRYQDSSLRAGGTPLPSKEVKVAGDHRSVVLTGLQPSTEYSIALYGLEDGVEGANVNTVARTSGLELESPQDLRFSDIRETSVGVNWRPTASRVDQYKVSFQLSEGGECNVSRTVLSDRSQLQLGGLSRDTEYQVSVRGQRGGQPSSPASATFTTGTDGGNYAGQRWGLGWVGGVFAPGRVGVVAASLPYLRATEISPRSALLSWTPPRAPPAGYLLSYETPAGETQEIPLDTSTTSHELRHLVPSSRYRVQLQAIRRGVPTAPTSTSFTTGRVTYPFPRDCSEELLNGPASSQETTIYLGGERERPLQVYCDMETDGGGWMVFQRRMNGEMDFWRDWQDYVTGFGNLSREFWLGNDALYRLTSSGDYELRVDLRARNESVYASYQRFRVDSPTEHYRLHLAGYSGTAGDAFGYHSGSVFSTRDRDPNRLIIPCAVSYRGAWWYRNCHYANLNGMYGNDRDHQGINWFNWKGFEFSIPFTEMKLRPRGFQPPRWP
uniref:Tenascin XB n=1 Tax=Sphenodon punctatus TaxID=8508 RepID=A0A8D0GHC1_SPHPU